MENSRFKFRAWDDELKTMFYSSTEQFDDSLLFRFEHFETEKPVYMPYVGLNDKTGKEIYEGDIVTAECYPFQDEGKYNYHGVVEWSDKYASFFLTKRLVDPDKRGISDGISEPLMDYDMSEFEIIGNIYEHPHLLDVEYDR